MAMNPCAVNIGDLYRIAVALDAKRPVLVLSYDRAQPMASIEKAQAAWRNLLGNEFAVVLVSSGASPAFVDRPSTFYHAKHFRGRALSRGVPIEDLKIVWVETTLGLVGYVNDRMQIEVQRFPEVTVEPLVPK